MRNTSKWKLKKRNSLFLLMFTICLACSTSPKNDPLKKPVLWEVSKNGKTHYFLGTIHWPLDIEKMYPQVYSQLKKSSILVTEINIAELNNQDLDQIQEGSLYYKDKNEGSLINDLSPKAYELVKDNIYFVEGGSKFSIFKPKKALNLLKTNVNLTETQSNEELFKSSEVGSSFVLNKDGRAYDQQLEDFARANNMKHFALEETQNTLLEKCHQLNAISKIEKIALDLKANTTSQFYEIAAAKSHECTLHERNRAWIPKILPILIREESAFVAVGMAHLLEGEDTILDLLAAEGYKFRYFDTQ